MKKALLILIGLVLISGFISGELQNIYKKGKITLKESKNFGKNTDWENIFYNPYSDIIASPDGSVFVVCCRQHCIYKFDKNGNFNRKFGQKGQGPSDMVSPGDPTIMENKYIVVGEYASNRRIDIWNLDGKFVKLVKTTRSNYETVALKENKIAYLAINQYAEKKNGYQAKYLVILKDINSGVEKTIREITLKDRHSIKVGQYISIGVGNYIGEVFMVQTGDGNLAVGVSNQPEIKIYSPEGKIIHSFKLKISPIPVIDEYIKNFKAEKIAELKRKDTESMNRTKRYWHDLRLKEYPKLDFSTIFTGNLPFYYKILVDGDGNFLVFKVSDCLKNCKTFFQVYSKKGEFICETELDKGKYDFDLDISFNKIYFAKEGIFGHFMIKGDEDEVFKLVKSNY